MFGFRKGMGSAAGIPARGPSVEDVRLALGVTASLANKNQMREQLRSALAAGARRITLDASATQYMDSAALGMLLQMSELAREQGVVLELTHVRAEIRTLLAMVKLDRLVAN